MMPVETGVGAYVMNFGAVGIVGTLFGMPIEALILGAMAGAVAQGLNPSGTRTKGISTVLVSMLLAGAFSPVTIEWLAKNIDIADGLNEQILLRPFVPVLIGAAWPWALPLLSDGVKKLWDGFVVVLIDRLINLFGGGK